MRSEGDPWGHPYLLRGFGSHLIAVSSPSRPLGLSPCFLQGLQSPLFTLYICFPRLDSLAGAHSDWVLHSLHTTSLSTFFLGWLVHFAPSGKLWAPCHLGQPPLFSILYFSPAAKGSLPFRSVPLVASSIFPCLLLFFSTLALGLLPFRSVPTARRWLVHLSTMDFDPDDSNTWPTDAESWYQVSYTTVTISNRHVPFPPEGYYMLSSVASLIVIPTIFPSITLPPPMSPTCSHLSLNGNSLERLGIILPALGESFGLITQLSLPSPLEVRSTLTVITSQSLKISLNMFKRRSLKNLTLIGTVLLPLGGIQIQALRPTVHLPQPRPTGTRIERPSFTRPALFQLFAEAFRPLPTLFSRFGDLTTKWGKRYSGWEIFTWLFPSMASKAPDPLPNPADATPTTLDTPFQALVDRFVDLDSTFADARKMSPPQIVPESVDHLTFLPAPSPSPFKLPALLEFLSARIAPTLADLRAHELSPPPFLTLIVGSPAHPLAGKALHSHLVGCFTNNETRYHFTLFVPVGPDPCLPVPLEWAPLFTALATICLYPFLPFLVCTPDYTLGTFSAVDDLTACFPRPAAFHAFSSNSSLVRPDVFLRLPPAANFTGQPVEGRPDFVPHTPAAAMTALLAARKTTYQHCPSSRESVETGSVGHH